MLVLLGAADLTAQELASQIGGEPSADELHRTIRRFRRGQAARYTVPTLLGNQLFPADNPWNQRITNAPVAANSATLVSSVGLGSPVHPDFGAALYNGAAIGIPFNVVSGTQPKVTVVLDAYADESDPLPVPIPANAVLEGDPLHQLAARAEGKTVLR